MLKRHVSKKNPTTKAELIQYCQEFWDEELTPDVCCRFIEHNFKVVPIASQIGGKATADLPKKLFKESSEGKSISHFVNILSEKEVQEKLQRLK